MHFICSLEIISHSSEIIAVINFLAHNVKDLMLYPVDEMVRKSLENMNLLHMLPSIQFKQKNEIVAGKNKLLQCSSE